MHIRQPARVLFGPVRLWLAIQTDSCIKVGAVDKSQGQEAAFAFFSMATSSAVGMPSRCACSNALCWVVEMAGEAGESRPSQAASA